MAHTFVNHAALCPTCGAENNHATGITPEGPRPGDAAVCVYCGTLLMYTEALDFRVATEDETATIRQHPLWSVMLLAFEEFRKSRIQ